MVPSPLGAETPAVADKPVPLADAGPVASHREEATTLVAGRPTPLRRFGYEIVRQAVRFVLVGTTFTLLYFALYGALRLVLPAVAANLLASLVTTIAGSEAHRRVTFDGRPSRRRRMVVQNVATWAWYGGTTSMGLLLLGLWTAEPTYAQEAATMLVITAVGGIARFVVLRWWVLSPARLARRASTVRA